MDEKLSDQSPKQKSVKKAFKYIALMFLIFILIAAIDMGNTACRLYKLVIKLENESIQILKNAKTVAERKEAVGSLGIFITLKDRSWIAIRYQDLHVEYWPSSAVALDSSGRWFASSYHFCGQFNAYKSMEKRNRDWIEMCEAQGESHESLDEMRAENLKDIHTLVFSENLTAAKKQLLKLRFLEISP